MSEIKYLSPYSIGWESRIVNLKGEIVLEKEQPSLMYSSVDTWENMGVTKGRIILTMLLGSVLIAIAFWSC